jgi:hypothetical protein
MIAPVSYQASATDLQLKFIWVDKQGVANAAFKSAREHFEKNSTLDDQEKSLVINTSCIEDIQKVVGGLLVQYQTKNASSKTRKWLQRASEAICHYGNVLDVFVQHHPEYVSLVWGTMKLLFVVSN